MVSPARLLVQTAVVVLVVVVLVAVTKEARRMSVIRRRARMLWRRPLHAPPLGSTDAPCPDPRTAGAAAGAGAAVAVGIDTAGNRQSSRFAGREGCTAARDETILSPAVGAAG